MPESVSESDFINSDYVDKVIVSGDRLKEHSYILNRLRRINLKSVKEESSLNARMMYIIKNNDDQEVFRVSMWGKNKSMFVNGVEVNEKKFLYDVIRPFLPDDVAKMLLSEIDNISG